MQRGWNNSKKAIGWKCNSHDFHEFLCSMHYQYLISKIVNCSTPQLAAIAMVATEKGVI